MPSPNEQAYTGFIDLPNVTTEWGRLETAIKSIMNGMATTTLVQVKAITADGDGYRVDIQPMVAQLDGAGNALAHGTIHDIPVWRVQGGTSALIVAPVVGDIGVAVFCSSDISGVKRRKTPTTPGSLRRYDWSDGIYFGGILGPAATQFLKFEDGALTITSTGTVTINAPNGATINAGDSLTLTAGTVTASGDLHVTGNISTGAGSTFNGKSFDNHTHSGVTTGSGNSGPPV